MLRYGLLALITLVAGAPMSWAQQQPAQPQSQPGQPQQPQAQQPQNPAAQPIPAYRSPFASAADNAPLQNGAGGDELVPDTRPLAGAQDLSIGAPRTGHGFWTPFIDASSEAYSNSAAAGTGSTGWGTWGSISGGVNLREISGNSDLTLSYFGGGAISSDGSNNWTAQQLGIAERYSFHRSVIALIDQFGYLPQAAFGYNGLGTGPGSNGTVGLQSGFVPAGSILTAPGQRLDNTSAAEFDRFMTRRMSLTFVGSYDIARYLDNGNLSDSNEAVAQAGFNYQLTPKDTLSVYYRFDGFRYSNIAQSINDHTIQVSYARRLVGKLALQVSAGPDYSISNVPISGSGTSVPLAPAGTTNLLSWSASANLTYQLLRRTTLSGSYFHGVTSGSGVLYGSITDTVSGDVSRQLSRVLNVDFSGGYSRNSGLGVSPTSSSTLSQQTFNYLFGGVNLTRAWGPSMRLYLGYQAQYQNSNSQFCITLPCSTTFLSNQISVGLGWHPRSFAAR